VTTLLPTRFTWTVDAEFEALIGLVETDPPGSGDCWDMTGYLDPFAIGPCGAPLSITTEVLPTGTYWFYLAHANFFCAPCGQWNDYVATLTCETPGNPGNTCQDPVVVDETEIPYIDVNTTCGRGNDYQDTCLGYYDGGEDIIYAVTFTFPQVVHVILDPQGTAWTGLAISDTCPPGETCLAMDTSSSTAPLEVTLEAWEPGTYFIMVDTWPAPDCIPQYELTICEWLP